MRSENMHILMVLESQYPAERGGGAEAQVRTLAQGLRRRGHRVTILTPMATHSSRETIMRVDRTPVVRLAYPHVPLLGRITLSLKLASFLWRRRRRYHAWHIHIAHYLGAVACVMGEWVGRPVILKVSGWWELEHGILADNTPFAHRLAFRCLLKASAWQAISHRISDALVDKGVLTERIHAIPNAVDTDRFRSLERASSRYCRFLFLGRLVPEKGLDTLLRAFHEVVRTCPDSNLRLVGDGPMAESLQSLAQSLDITGSIEFAGHRSDIEEQFSRADFVVLPSRIEGLSNTLLEGLTAGLPAIVTRVSGSEDVVQAGENGWLCEPGDQAGLEACLRDAALLAPERRAAMSARARASVAAYAGLEIVLERLLRLYAERIVAAPVADPASDRRG